MIVQLLLLLPQSSADGGPCVSVGIWNFFHSSWSWRRSEPVTVVPRHTLFSRRPSRSLKTFFDPHNGNLDREPKRTQ
uniref:Putative secreted protein n=1 Tax=Anopheles darlingi TaxID=43151 RepID=A0A2M4DBW0_ANODA